ncbi:11183_t:CDS:1, partial [Acaulospora morrowiae]
LRENLTDLAVPLLRYNNIDGSKGHAEAGWMQVSHYDFGAYSTSNCKLQ